MLLFNSHVLINTRNAEVKIMILIDSVMLHLVTCVQSLQYIKLKLKCLQFNKKKFNIFFTYFLSMK